MYSFSLAPSISILYVISSIFSGVLDNNAFILGTERIIYLSQSYWITVSVRISYAFYAAFLLFLPPPPFLPFIASVAQYKFLVLG